ncbi:Dual_specificity protein phosphatase CDC14A [Hexamita inflata]|uniref:protein-tyrosine-phosphatase n=1 Tax=Hexamita inflata TaxID=28002 RepID=A0AA86UFL1_9EUKA|nr:Dual specificity protein phosphatase CDC14A [Hexamita inflata]
MSGPFEFIPDQVFIQITDQAPQNDEKYIFFSIESVIVYKAYNQDFGPMSIQQTYDFVKILDDQLKQRGQKILILYCSSKPSAYSNLLALLCLYLVVKGEDLKSVLTKLQKMPQYVPFRDISNGACPYGVTVDDLVCAFIKARQKQVHIPDKFTSAFISLQKGNISEIVSGKLYACPSPIDPQHVLYKQQPLSPVIFTKAFKELGVKALVRLNDSYYQRSDFINQMIRHYDLQFPDGSTPPDDLILKFFKIIDDDNCVAVHCMAGLGRTGTLLSLELMRKYEFTAREAIAWLRLSRPGSISGQQQSFLCGIEDRIKKLGVKKQLQIVPKYTVFQIDNIDDFEENKTVTRANVNKRRGKTEPKSGGLGLPMLKSRKRGAEV